MKIIRTFEDIAAGTQALRLIDPRLEHVVEKAGEIPLRLNEPGFSGIAHIIVSQMVSRASAEAIWRRIVAGTGEVTAQSFLSVDKTTLSTFGLSRAKTKTLLGVAKAVECGELDLIGLSRMEGKAALTSLTALNGIGPWTAEVYLMFCGGHADIFPAGDVALQTAVMQAFKTNSRPTSKDLVEIARIWSPWRSVAARIFWAYYGVINRRDALPAA